MTLPGDEEPLLRSVALDTARATLLARQRAEEELLRAKEALERKTAELAHSLSLMRATLESTTDGILVTDGAGSVTLFNGKYVDLWRLPRVLVDSRDHRQLLEFMARQFADPRQFLFRIEEIQRTSPPESYDVLELADGRVFERYSTIQVVDERTVGRVWSLRDVTQHRLGERALRDSEARFRVLAETIPAVVWTAEPDGTITYVNDRWSVYTGQTAEQNARDWTYVVHPDDRDGCVARWARARADGTEYEVEARQRRSDGEYRWFLTRAVPIRDAAGRITTWFGTSMDIHGQKQATIERQTLLATAEAARADAEARLREVARLATMHRDLPASLRVDDLLVTLCRAARELLGSDGATFVVREDDRVRYAAEDALAPLWPGQTFPISRCIAGWVILEDSAAVVEDVYTDERIRIEEYERTFVKSLLMVPVRGETPIGAMGVYWQAPHRATEREIRLLEALAGPAGVALQNARLFAEVETARGRAEAQNRAKDEFLAMLGHELRNPLGAIGNAISVLNQVGDSQGSTVTPRQIITRQVQHVTRLVEDLLDVARITAGRIVLQRRPVDFKEIVDRGLASLALTKSADHEVVFTGESVVVDGDSARLEQVVWNLLENAMKYTPPGGRIFVTLRGDADEGVLRVEDNGIGMAAELLPQVFEPFVQGERSLDRAKGGLGLGLTLVKRLVEAHGGSVSASSSGLGQGSTFELRLPRLVQVPSRPVSAAAPVAMPARRVLIIDDHEDFREMLRILLTLHGHEVEEAADGVGGLDRLRTVRPDVALVDVGLPGLDGYALARAARAGSDTANVRLIALTGYGRPEDQRRALEAGFDAHLVKPVDEEALLRAVVAASNGRGMGA